jgi:hypothetical protein
MADTPNQPNATPNAADYSGIIGATATAPVEQQTSSPITGQLQPPAAQPQAQSAPAMQPAAVPSVAQTSPNKHLMAFGARLLSAIAGDAPRTYTVDPNSQQLVANPAGPETSGDKVKRILSHALTGLSAPADPNQKSGLAKGLSGLGAGVGAVRQQAQQQDQAAQQKGKEDFEREQQMQLRKMEIGRANALNLSLHYDNVRKQNDLDPVRAQNKEIADAFRSMPDHGVREMSASAAEAAVRDPKNPTWGHTHLILPAGMQDVTDENGNPLKDADGNYREEGRVYVIDGLKDGKVPLPASIVSDVQKFKAYGDLAQLSGLDGLKAGDEYDPNQFVSLYSRLLSAKKEVANGWSKPELSEDKDGNVLQRNSVNNETKPATDEMADAFKMRKAKLAETASITNKNNAEATKAKKDATANPVSNLTGEEYLKTLPTGQQSTVRAVGEGRQSLPANRKEALALLEQVQQAYPDFDESKVKTWQKANNEYRGSGKTATQVVPAYNTALEHMQDLYNNTTGDGIFNPLSKAYQDREVALGYVSREVGKAVSAGALTQKEGQDLLDTLKGGLTPALKRERITKTAQLLHDKIDEYQTKFNESAPSSAVKVPTLISPKAAQSYDYIQSGGKSVAQQPQNAPPVNLLKEGIHTTFGNGQVWTLQNGQPVQVKTPGQGN